MGSRSSNTSSLRCPDATTTSCVEWSGGDFPCLQVCTGDSLTDLQTSVLTKLCEVLGGVDMTSVILPDCLKAAWNTEDPTILNFIQFLLDEHCQLQVAVNQLPTTNNPIFSLDYKCCANNPCITETVVSVSQHLQNILTCLCTQSARIDELETQVSNLQDTANTALALAQSASTAVASWSLYKNCILEQTGCS